MADSVDLTQVVLALSDAIDLVGVDVVQHGKRVAFVADATARALDLPDGDVQDLFLACLLHDCGVSSTRAAGHLLSEVDWEESNEHCVRGADLLSRFEPFARLARIVRLHHAHWDGGEPQAEGDGVGTLANLVFLADRVDTFLQKSGRKDVLLSRVEIRESVAALSGSFFSPDLVQAFLAVSGTEAFWLTLEAHHLERWLLEHPAVPHPVTTASLRDLAHVFARIVDAKSRFTADHSEGVARLAGLLGRLAGLPADTCERLQIAGLLHDLGKLRVPDEVLEKPGSLDDGEFAAVERHTFETYQILRRIEPFAEVAEWAAFHHEALSGRGYPFHRRAEELPVPARLVAAADVFQALAQNRPYRGPVPPHEILAELRKMAGSGKLDPDAVAIVEGHLFECWSAAVGEPVPPPP